MPTRQVKKQSDKIYSLTRSDRFVFCGQIGRLPPVAHDFCEEEITVERRERIEHHLKRDDYFRTMASILQVLMIDKEVDKNKVLAKLICDFLYVQKKYKIIER